MSKIGSPVKLDLFTANAKGSAETSTSNAVAVVVLAAAGCSTAFLKIERGISHRPGDEILTRRIASETCSKSTATPSRSGPSEAPCVETTGASAAERTFLPLPSALLDSEPGTTRHVDAQRPQDSSQKPANSGLVQLPQRV